MIVQPLRIRLERKKVAVRKKLKEILFQAEEIREQEIRSQAEEDSALGDGWVTLTYENLIEHEKCRSQWRKIKYSLKQGNTEPLTRLLL